MFKTLLNVGLFYVVWFVTAYGAGSGMPLLGPVSVVLALLVHVPFVQRASGEWVFLGLLTLTGFVFDTVMTAAGILAFPEGQGIWPFPPLWIGGLWLIFGTLFDQSLRWLLPRPWLALMLGALGGPLAYYTGQQMGAILLPIPPLWTVLLLGVEWALVMVLALWFAQRFLPPAGAYAD